MPPAGAAGASNGFCCSDRNRSTRTPRGGTPSPASAARTTARYGSGPQMNASKARNGRASGREPARRSAGPAATSSQCTTSQPPPAAAASSRSAEPKITEPLVPVGVHEHHAAAPGGQHRLQDRHHRRDPAARREQQEVAVQRARAEHPGRRQHVEHGPGADVVGDPVRGVSAGGPLDRDRGPLAGQRRTRQRVAPRHRAASGRGHPQRQELARLVGERRRQLRRHVEHQRARVVGLPRPPRPPAPGSSRSLASHTAAPPRRRPAATAALDAGPHGWRTPRSAASARRRGLAGRTPRTARTAAASHCTLVCCRLNLAASTTAPQRAHVHRAVPRPRRSSRPRRPRCRQPGSAPDRPGHRLRCALPRPARFAATSASQPRPRGWCRSRTRAAPPCPPRCRPRRSRTARTSGAAGRPGRPRRTAAGCRSGSCASRCPRPAGSRARRTWRTSRRPAACSVGQAGQLLDDHAPLQHERLGRDRVMAVDQHARPWHRRGSRSHR